MCKSDLIIELPFSRSFPPRDISSFAVLLRKHLKTYIFESHYIFVYWIVGTFDADVETITLSVGIVRAFESVGSALAFGIGAARVQPMVNLTIAFVAFAVCIVPTYMVTFMVPDHPREKGKSAQDVTQGVAEA